MLQQQIIILELVLPIYLHVLDTLAKEDVKPNLVITLQQELIVQLGRLHKTVLLKKQVVALQKLHAMLLM